MQLLKPKVERSKTREFKNEKCCRNSIDFVPRQFCTKSLTVLELMYKCEGSPELLALLLYNKIPLLGVPIVEQWLMNLTRNCMRLQVRSLALLSGLRIQRCRELWCGSQTRLGSRVAEALAQASNYSSDSTPSLGTSICRKSGPRNSKKTKKKKKKKKNFNENQIKKGKTGVPLWCNGLKFQCCHQRLRSDPWLSNFQMPWAQPKKKKERKERKEGCKPFLVGTVFTQNISERVEVQILADETGQISPQSFRSY